MYLHNILGHTEECLDTQVLFNPFEEQFHLPAAFAKLGDSDRRQRKGYRKKPQILAV